MTVRPGQRAAPLTTGRHEGPRPSGPETEPWSRRTALRLLASLAAVPGIPAARAGAQTGGPLFDGPVTLVVPFAPGGSTDVAARLLAPELSARLRVPVIVENRSGAGGAIGLRHVQAVRPDLANRTILVGSNSTQIIAPLMDPQNVGFNPVEEMVPIALIGTYAAVVVTSAGSGIGSISDLRRMAGEPLHYGSPGTNSAGHLLNLLLARSLGATAWEHVPYRGAGPVMAALMSNEIKLAFDAPIVVRPLVQAGTARALAVSSAERSPLFPGVPTLREEGVDLLQTSFFGLLGPRAMEPRVADDAAAATADALGAPGLRQRLEDLGLQVPDIQSRDGFLEFQRGEYRRFEPLAPARAGAPR